MSRRVSLMYKAALQGREPAEALDGAERERLLFTLWMRRWTDQHIAEHTKWTTYTVARIRSRIGLPARTQMPGAA